MSIRLVKQVIADRDPRLTPSLKLTLTVVASHHYDKAIETGTRVKTSRLSQDTGFSVRTVERHLDNLASIGKVTLERPHPKRISRILVVPNDTRDGHPNDTSDVCQTSPVTFPNDTSDVSTYQVPSQVEEQQVPTGEKIARAEREPREEDMGDPRLEGRSVFDEDKPKPKKKAQTVTPGTAAWLEHEWGRHLVEYTGIVDWDRRVFRRSMKNLRERGHTNEQIAAAIRTWVISNATFIKTKREVDPTKLFMGAVNNGALRRAFTPVNKEKNTAGGFKTANELMGLE